MMRRLLMVAIFGALFSASALLPSPLHLNAHAQSNTTVTEPAPEAISTDADTKTKTTGGSEKTCESIPEAQGGALIGKIVPCLTHTIQESTIMFAQEIIAWMMPIFYAFLLLVVVFFGVRVLQNEPEVYKQGFLLLVKIAIVATILADLGNTASYDLSGGSEGKLIPATYGVMSEMQEIVSGAINSTSLTCDVAKYKGPETPQVWAVMDCVMGKLYGFTMGSGGKPSMLLVTSVAGLLTGFLFGGAWGVAVFFGMVAVLFSMFMLVVRTVVGFLIGYLIVCLMFIISPFFLPLVFLRGTAQYYESYWRTILRAMLTPVIITAYTMFALIIYDKMLFAPNSIVQKLFQFDQIKDALQDSKKPCDRHTDVDPLEVRFSSKPTDAQKDSLFKMPNLQNLSFPTLSGANDACGAFKIPVFKMEKIGGAKEGEQKKDLTKIFMQLIELFILAYLISEGQKSLPSIISQLVGGSSTMIGVKNVVEAGGKYEQSFNEAKERAMGAFQKTPGDKTSGFRSGADYLEHMPRDVTNAISDIRKNTFTILKK